MPRTYVPRRRSQTPPASPSKHTTTTTTASIRQSPRRQQEIDIATRASARLSQSSKQRTSQPSTAIRQSLQASPIPRQSDTDSKFEYDVSDDEQQSAQSADNNNKRMSRRKSTTHPESPTSGSKRSQPATRSDTTAAEVDSKRRKSIPTKASAQQPEPSRKSPRPAAKRPALRNISNTIKSHQQSIKSAKSAKPRIDAEVDPVMVSSADEIVSTALRKTRQSVRPIQRKPTAPTTVQKAVRGVISKVDTVKPRDKVKRGVLKFSDVDEVLELDDDLPLDTETDTAQSSKPSKSDTRLKVSIYDPMAPTSSADWLKAINA